MDDVFAKDDRVAKEGNYEQEMDELAEEGVNEEEMDDGLPQLTFDNVCVNVRIMTDDEDDELQAARTNVRKSKMGWMEKSDNRDGDANEGHTNPYETDILDEENPEVDEDDRVNSGSEEEDDSNDSVYYDSDDLGSFYSESDEEYKGDAMRRPSNRFWYDPNTQVPIFGVEMIFKNIEECRHALSKYATVKKLAVHFVKNDKSRVRAECAVGCPWKFLASKDGKEENLIVKTYKGHHHCHIVNQNRMATSKFLAKHLLTRLVSQPNMKQKDIKTLCRVDLKLNVSLTMCKNIKKRVFKDLQTLYTNEYSRLHNYVEELKNSNPGTTCIVTASRETGVGLNHFVRFYVCFDACKKGWLGGCRKIIGLDGCFLKGLCKGQLLCAVGRDGNNQIFPLAWAVVSVENKFNWGWFLKCLKYDLPLGDGKGYTIISDMQKGLEIAIEEQLPEIEHRMCARHVYASWAKKWKGEERKIEFWKCAKSTYVEELRKNLKLLELMGDEIVQDFLDYDIEKFCKPYFRCDIKCDVIDNNLSETFNGWILEARCKPIISMLEDIRVQVMTRLHVKRRMCTTWINDVAPRAMQKLEKNKNLSHIW
ncbi:uncharacterized protein LOC126682013 [Mercurialis annua]|uniref:uncharacterized protein LOC126682013 n=1 Tax=Mercurialis annua TaxID=3986 RepID=UPI00215F81A5|nr:uncharacterized protein LOC126682013 [Mercurialis annua]